MTPSPCHKLDLYLDGDLPEADLTAFEAHAEACSECTADLAAARLLEAEWTRLATIPAPAHLVEAALREAKRGPQDRQPVRGSRRRYGRLAGRVTFGVLVIALASAAVWMSRDASPSLQASADPPPTIDTTAAPIPRESIPEAAATEETFRPPDAAPAPIPPRPAAAPVRRQQTVPPPRPAPIEPPVQLVENTVPPADSVAQAQEDLMLALALVADAQSRARSTVTTEIGRAAGALTESRLF